MAEEDQYPAPARPSRALMMALIFLIGSLVAAVLILTRTFSSEPNPGAAVRSLTPTTRITSPTATRAPTLPVSAETSPTPPSAQKPVTPQPDRLLVGVVSLDGSSTPGSEMLAAALRSAFASADLSKPVEVTIAELPAGITDTTDIDVARDTPGISLLVVWQEPVDGLTPVTMLAPFVPPTAAALTGEPVPSELTVPDGYPILVEGDFAFPAELAAALFETTAGATGRARERLNVLQGKLLETPSNQVNNHTAVLQFALGRVAAVDGDLIGALQHTSQALRLANGFVAARMARGNTYLALGDAEAAVTAYTLALEADPMLVGALYNHALALRALGDLDAALDDADQLAMLAPEAAWSANLRGMIYYERGDYQAALADFELAAGLAPEQAEPLFNQALTLRAMEDYGRALVVFDALVEMQPDNATYHAYFGEAFDAAGQPEQAERAYDEAIRIDPDYTEAYLRRGRARFTLGAYQEALADALQALELDPMQAQAFWLAGDAYLAQEAFDQAERVYSMALELGLAEPEIYAGRGWAFHRLQYRAGAIADYEQALTLGLNDPLLLKRTGFALFDAGRYDAARDMFTAALNQAPNDAETAAGLALTYDASIQREDAERQYQQALDRDPRLGQVAYLEQQPLWSEQAITRAVSILHRMEIDPYTP